ncbi:PaaI family thioesterase [Ferroacidibacillus organovorans]|uniref:PaaI family thioesterase n=1 Tax=Ferroacidibacillus organovorans TaxID=1765683 RepID=UPI001F18933D|nr:PaaI family thioesterase [Ferroacidibacillus organovorans]
MERMEKSELLKALEDYDARDLEIALRAADANRRARTGELYFLHHLFEEQFDWGAAAEKGEIEITLPINLLVMNPGKMVHGGVLALLCDNAMGIASHARAMRDGVTVELTVRYHKPARGTKLRAVGRVVSAGSQVNSTQCEIYDDEGQLVTSASGTFYHKKPR